MAAPRKHDTDAILDAARALVLARGPRAAGVTAISRASGAPVGTLYHRFGDRDGVLAATWLRALRRFQSLALAHAAAAAADHPGERAVALGMAVLAFARREPEDVQLLLALRRDDLLDAAPDDALAAAIAEINAPLEHLLVELARALYGRAGARQLDRVRRAVVDIPYAAVRRHPVDPPRWLGQDVEAAIRAVTTT